MYCIAASQIKLYHYISLKFLFPWRMLFQVENIKIAKTDSTQVELSEK